MTSLSNLDIEAMLQILEWASNNWTMTSPMETLSRLVRINSLEQTIERAILNQVQISMAMSR